MKTRLYVIKKRGQDQYWTCSSEHGSGWHDKHPKQSFSPSELTREIRRLIDRDWFPDVEILELCIRGAEEPNSTKGGFRMPSDTDVIPLGTEAIR